MLQASVHFASKVGVAPATTTLVLGDANCLGTQCFPVPDSRKPVPVPPKRPTAISQDPWRYYVPYATPSDFNVNGRGLGNGLGLINETDAWLTGRPYGLPGTTAIRFNKEADGQYRSTLIGADDGSMMGLDQDGALTAVMLQLIEVQKAQQKAVSRIAFWAALTGGITVGTVVVAVIAGVMAAGHAGKTRRAQEA